MCISNPRGLHIPGNQINNDISDNEEVTVSHVCLDKGRDSILAKSSTCLLGYRSKLPEIRAIAKRLPLGSESCRKARITVGKAARPAMTCYRIIRPFVSRRNAQSHLHLAKGRQIIPFTYFPLPYSKYKVTSSSVRDMLA